MNTELRRILLVEDSPSDRLLAQLALSEVGVGQGLTCVEDGEQALRYLRREQEFESAPRPDLVLLDLNLPRVSGLEVLEHIKRDAGLRSIPVVVLTTSAAPEDVMAVYDRYANGMVRKPVDFTMFSEAVRKLGQYWFEVMELPPETPA